MTQMKTAWRRAVDTIADPACPSLCELLAMIGADAEASTWDCADLECAGPVAAELRDEAVARPLSGHRLIELASGIDTVHEGVFEATRPGDDRPWLALRAVDGNRFVVATRSRMILDRMRAHFQQGSVKEC
jgi:hypothetical protein